MASSHWLLIKSQHLSNAINFKPVHRVVLNMNTKEWPKHFSIAYKLELLSLWAIKFRL